MTFDEHSLKFRILGAVLVCNIVEQFVLLLENPVLELLAYAIILLIKYVHLRRRVRLQVRYELRLVLLPFVGLHLLDELPRHF
jgi:hypothetical protein